MKVCELIAKLQQLDGGLDVICYTDSEALPPSENAVVPFDVLTVSQSEGGMGGNSPRGFRFGHHEHSQLFALIEITADH